MKTAVFVAACESYRIQDFVAAAEVLRCRAVVASDGESPLADGGFVRIDMTDPESAAAAIAREVPDASAIVAADDSGVVIAARAARLLGLPHNAVGAAAATRDKLLMRDALRSGGVSQPAHRWGPLDEIPALGAEIGFPVVIKPRRLSASRGVIRADGPAEAASAAARAQEIAVAAGHDPGDGLVVEKYVPGVEIAIEGLLMAGELEVLAVIDKPVPLEGPYFAETIFVTPSRLSTDVIARATSVAAAACAALELNTGPIHAELRIEDSGEPRVIEVAARTIGGLCGRSLAFGLLGETLETVVLRGALAEPIVDVSAAQPASGVMMLPIEDGGVLDDIEGIAEVLAIPGITGVDITATKGKRVEALPAADRYLGFVFAAGADAAEVEALLRQAAAELTVVIDGEDVGPLI
jgi:biotin carboxylase